MKQENETDALRRKIESHPLLNLPKAERAAHIKERNDLYELILAYYGFDESLRTLLDDVDRNALQENEAALKSVLSKQKKQSHVLDPLVSLCSLNKALGSFDAERGVPFLAYLRCIYDRDLPRYAGEHRPNQGSRMNRNDRVLWKKLTHLCEQLGADPMHLKPRYCTLIAELLEIDEEKVKTLVYLAANVQHYTSLDTPVEDDEGGQSTLDAPDENAADPQRDLEKNTQLLRVVTDFSDADLAEYPRLFFTNDTMAAMRQNPPEPALLNRLEAPLWGKIFVIAYLQYVLAPPPEPDCLRNALAARQVQPLRHATIAKFKNVSAPAVSQQYARYKKILAQIAARCALS